MSSVVVLKTNKLTFNFDAWQGRPQMPRPVLETVTRLGGKNLIVQQLRTEAAQTQSTAIMIANKPTSAASVDYLEGLWQTLRRSFGFRGTWTDENGIIIDNFFIIDGTRSIKVQEGLDTTAVMEMSLTCAVDGEDYNAN